MPQKYHQLKLYLITIIALSACNGNNLIKKDLTPNKSTFQNFEQIKKLNKLLLTNIITITDSCCRHNKSCDYDSLDRLTISVPLNQNLAKKYTSPIEPLIEELIQELTPGSIQSNNNPIRGNINIKLDSTISYNCYHRMYSDTVIQHQLIYKYRVNNEAVTNPQVEIVYRKQLEHNWTYRIIKYHDTW